MWDRQSIGLVTSTVMGIVGRPAIQRCRLRGNGGTLSEAMDAAAAALARHVQAERGQFFFIVPMLASLNLTDLASGRVVRVAVNLAD